MTLPTLTAALRTDPVFARALAAALRTQDRPCLPDIAVALWRRDPCDHAVPDDPGWTCRTITGAIVGYTCRTVKASSPRRWVAFVAVPPVYAARGDYAARSTWPRPAQDADEGIVIVTDALAAAGWTVHMPPGWTPGTRGTA